VRRIGRTITSAVSDNYPTLGDLHGRTCKVRCDIHSISEVQTEDDPLVLVGSPSAFAF
jgi:hypothetical protein